MYASSKQEHHRIKLVSSVELGCNTTRHIVLATGKADTLVLVLFSFSRLPVKPVVNFALHYIRKCELCKARFPLAELTGRQHGPC